MSGWVALSNTSSLYTAVEASCVVLKAVCRGVIYIGSDGIFVPWYMGDMGKNLTDIKQIMDNLTVEQRRLINELREESVQSLATIEETWASQSDRYNLLLKNSNEAGVIGKLWTNKKQATDLRNDINKLYVDVLATTTGPLRRALREKQAEEERQAIQDAENQAMVAIITAGEAGCDMIQLVPMSSSISRRSTDSRALQDLNPLSLRATNSAPLRAYFPEILPYIACT